MSPQDKIEDEHEIHEVDYPALYQAADTASIDSQRIYLFIMVSYLLLLIVGVGFTIYADNSRLSGILAALLFLGTLFLSIFQASKRYDRTWYNARAVAESVKTRTWRYMMRAEPYESMEPDTVAQSNFSNDLLQILNQNRELGPNIGGDFSAKEQITLKMNEVRQRDLPERLKLYRKERIDEQRTWYAIKSATNRRSARNWFITMIVFQALAIICLLVQIGYPHLDYLPTEIFIIAAGSTLTWMQVKRFQELSTAYSLTAHEIGFIKSQSESVESESQLSNFVKDAENAFSREHTQLWHERTLKAVN